MSALEADLQARVEAVLGTLVRAAAVELIQLFESRFPASPWGPGIGAGGKERFEGPKRSVGVQVEAPGTVGLLVPPTDEDYLRDYREGKQQQGAAADHSQVALKQQEAGVAEFCPCEADGPADRKPPTDPLLDVQERRRSAQSPAAKSEPLAARPETRHSDLILKLESEEPAVAQPRQARVDGSARSRRLSAGPPAPAEVGLLPRAPTEKNDPQVKLKLTSPAPGPTRRCRVRLVDVLAASGSEGTPGGPGPKDLRPHRGLHTGRRICCFSPCGNGVWRLKKGVAPTRGGYDCGVCRRTFTRRKVLRRHQRFHSGEKPYSCPVCSKAFALRKSLRRHQRFHSGERPHVCAKCSKRFRLRGNLKAHLRFHSGEKPFGCPACGRMFRVARNLEAHRCLAAPLPSFRVISGL